MACKEAQLAGICCLFLALAFVHGGGEGEQIAVAMAEALGAVSIANSNTAINMISGTLDLIDLPKTIADRPPRPAAGWGFCNSLDTLGTAACVAATPTVSTDAGALLLSIQHKPLSNVTPKMMKWLYENLGNYYSYQVNKTTYNHTLFMRMHPVDHAYHASSNTPAAVGSTLDWIETPLYGCTQRARTLTAAAKKKPYVCTNTRQGPVQIPAPQNLAQLFKTKISTVVAQLDENGYTSYTQITNSQLEAFLGTAAWNVSNLQHSWAVTASGKLAINTTLRLGLLSQGNDTFYQPDPTNPYGSIAVSTANGVIGSTFNSTAQWRQKTVEWLGYAQAMHYVQEVQLLPRWLPATYKQYGPK